MRIVFMGSGSLACPPLSAILADCNVEVAAVVSQPDRRSGRRLAVQSSPVKELGEENGLRVATPENVNEEASLALLRDLRPDVIVVVAYGQILKPQVLSLPAQGCINLHGSLLPKYRGAAPIQWAIVNGETTTGVTTMFLDNGVDSGDIILQHEVAILEDDTADSLSDRLAAEGAGLLVQTLALMRTGSAPRRPQDHEQATYAPKLQKEDGHIDWTMPASAICNRVRGFNPWPGCRCEWPRGSGHMLRVLKARVEEAGDGVPGGVIDLACGPLVKAGNLTVRLLEVQPESGKIMSGESFLLGHPMTVGDVIG